MCFLMKRAKLFLRGTVGCCHSYDRYGSCKLAAECESKVLIFFYVMVGGGFVLVISVRPF